MRSVWSGGLVFLAVSGHLWADDIKGDVKKWDAETKRLIVSVAARDREIEVPDAARILDARGAEAPERLRSKVFQTRPSAKITATTNAGKVEAQTIRLTRYYLERPDDFYLDPATAGPDFQTQGEYEGEISGQGKLGAQVVAQDDGLFSVVFWPGGLPGAGSDARTKVVRAAAATVDGRTTITGVWSGEITGGKLSGKTASGQAFVLTRLVRKSPTLGARPPADAVVLFDGSGTDNFPKARMSDDKLLKVPATTRRLFRDFHLHAEFLIPYRGPSGGNSGVFLQNRYEIQVFDSFGGQQSERLRRHLRLPRPDVNVSFPPLSWQTFDVDYTAARFDPEGKMVKRPVVTVRHNDIVVHENVTLPEKGNGGPPSPEGGPLFLQAHGSPVRYRNIWVVERNER